MSEYIYGKNTVKEALLNNHKIIKLFSTQENQFLIDLAKKNNINYEITNNKCLDKKVNGLHQGVVLEIESYSYVSLQEIVVQKPEKYPLLIMLDGLEDPHNFGAILRTCDAANVDGVIISKNRSVQLNGTVAKVSTGAIEYVKVCQVTNLVTTIKELKAQGYWIVGAEVKEKSINYNTMKYDMPICLVIGSEGKGISRLVMENCDFLIKIPMFGHVNSLNASVSCSILIYEVLKYRAKE